MREVFHLLKTVPHVSINAVVYMRRSRLLHGSSLSMAALHAIASFPRARPGICFLMLIFCHGLCLPPAARIDPNFPLPSSQDIVPSSPPARSPPSPHARPTLIHRPLRNLPLRLHPLHNLLPPRLHHHTPHNHLSQHRMQRLEIENQIQFTHILEKIIQALDEHVDQVQQRERTFGGSGDDDEVQRGIVAVRDERGRIVGLGLGC